MTGYQVFAMVVGIVGGMFLLASAQANESNSLRWFGLVWLAIWCIPPLVVLWIKAVFS